MTSDGEWAAWLVAVTVGLIGSGLGGAVIAL
jgi:hypothetical protein